MNDLVRRIENKSAVIGVIGLGYVGLTVAVCLAEAGFRVVGVDLKADRIASINAGKCPIDGDEPELPGLMAAVTANQRLVATTSYAPLAECDVVLVDVETPVDDDHTARFGSLRAACRDLATVMKKGALVVVESTIAPGTCDNVVKSVLESGSGRKLGEGFFLGHCPERVMPGRLLKNLRELSRVCGGDSPATSRAMVALYKQFVRGSLAEADCVTAELVKTAENTYRDVNIAFANELGMICEAVGADFSRVRELVNESPGRNVLFAGGGVGGHCIPKDPWLLVQGAANAPGFAPRLVAAARAVNDGMPLHVARLVEDALAEKGAKLQGAKVAVLGFSYLENSGDARNSPTESLVGHLRDRGATVAIHDPWVAEYEGEVFAALTGANAVVVMVAHDVYRALDLKKVREKLATPVLVDARNVFSAEAIASAGLTFRGVGRGRR